MNVLLVGNFSLDNQESMLRFGQLLNEKLQALGHSVRYLQPQPQVSLWAPHQLSKWMGYIDKYLLFPRQLRQHLDWADVVHVCDHSNSPYLSALQTIPHIITCHDLLAVRGALGDRTIACESSWAGQFLQRWILSGLRQANCIACISEATRQDVEVLVLSGSDRPATEGVKSPITTVVLNGLNHSYHRLPGEEVEVRLGTLVSSERFQSFDSRSPYLLHVGQSHPRKNRDGILRIVAQLGDRWPGQMVFAGKPLSGELVALAAELGVVDRIVEVLKPSNDQLEALYNGAFAMLFPSRAEGFGWPPIEAQACGCPVIVSDRTSLPEVVGESGIVCPLEDIDSYVGAIVQLEEDGFRQQMIDLGFQNIQRFTAERMVNDYIDLYEALLGESKLLEVTDDLATTTH